MHKIQQSLNIQMYFFTLFLFLFTIFFQMLQN